MANGDFVQDSIGSLIRGILSDLRALIREEIALARVEIREQAGRAKAAALSFGIAAAGSLVLWVEEIRKLLLRARERRDSVAGVPGGA